MYFLGLVVLFFQLNWSTQFPAKSINGTKGPNVQMVSSCSDVLQFYKYAGLAVDDCANEPYSKSLLWRVDNPLTWQQARDNCRKIVTVTGSADLAMPKTFPVRQMINALDADKLPQGQSYLWTGIQRVNDNLVFIDNSSINQARWFDGAENRGDCAVSYLVWEGSGGDNGFDDYTLRFGFFTEPCANEYMFVCQAFI